MEFRKTETLYTYTCTLKMVERTRPFRLRAVCEALPKGARLSHECQEGTYKDADGNLATLVTVRVTTSADATTVKRVLASVEASAVKVRASRAKVRTIPAKRAPKSVTVQCGGAPGRLGGTTAIAETPPRVEVAPIVRRVVRNAAKVA